MIRDALLAGGIAMAYAAQLSVPGLPFGYTELLLSLWIMLSLGRILAGGRLEATPALFRLASFWVIMTLAWGIGLIIGMLTSVIYLSAPVHDMTAYVLLASVTCLAAAEPDAELHLRRTAWWVIGIANACFLFQLALGWGFIHQSGVDPWFWDRFDGWSENPNQLALYCALFSPLALYLATTTVNPWARIFGFSSIGLTFLVGKLTKSDTFLLTSILTLVIFLGLRARTWFTSGGDRGTVFRQVTLLLMVGFLPLAMSMTPYVVTEIGSVEDIAKGLSRGKGGEETAETAELRLSLWADAFNKGLTSGSLGLGPGPHVDRPVSVYRQFKREPFEAHSTYLDTYTQGGLIAVLALLWILGSAALAAWRAKLDALLALMVSIFFYGFPHLIVRHPIVWFAVTLCLVVGTSRAVSVTPNRTYSYAG